MSFTGRTAVVTGAAAASAAPSGLEAGPPGANVVFSYAGNTAAAEATRKELEALASRPVPSRAVWPIPPP